MCIGEWLWNQRAKHRAICSSFPLNCLHRSLIHLLTLLAHSTLLMHLLAHSLRSSLESDICLWIAYFGFIQFQATALLFQYKILVPFQLSAPIHWNKLVVFHSVDWTKIDFDHSYYCTCTWTCVFPTQVKIMIMRAIMTQYKCIQKLFAWWHLEWFWHCPEDVK